MMLAILISYEGNRKEIYKEMKFRLYTPPCNEPEKFRERDSMIQFLSHQALSHNAFVMQFFLSPCACWPDGLVV